jgi:uncharacterized membrane protein YccC
MNQLTKGKIILSLAVIFLAGGITGAVFSWGEARQKWSRPPSPKFICDHFRARLEQELGLTADQVRQLDPLLQKRVKAMEEIHKQAVHQIEELVRTSDEEIANALNLSPAQREKLQQLEKNRRARFGGKGRRDGPPAHGDRAPPPR